MRTGLYEGGGRYVVPLDVEKKTIRRVALATVLLVGLTEPQADRCRRALASLAMRMARVAHIAAAVERIPVVMPCIVVIDQGTLPEERAKIADAITAVGAELIAVDHGPDVRMLEERFRSAGERATRG